MIEMKKIFPVAVAAVLCTPAFADVQVEFVEGAPKDRFVVTNAGSCDLDATEVTLDLSTSASGVIFDVSETGAGVEVFQPFEVYAGGGFVAEVTEVADGDRAVTLKLDSLPAGQSVAFTIDVDDTRGGREITVSDGEIRGATATVVTASWTGSAAFGKTADLTVPRSGCS